MAGIFTPDDLAVEIHGEDLAWPLVLDGNGDLAVISGEANTMSALPVRAVTGLGEIPLFPDDGLDLDDMQNGLQTDDDRAAARARLLAQFRREDRIESLRVTASDGRDVTETVFELEAKLRGGRVESTSVPFGSG